MMLFADATCFAGRLWAALRQLLVGELVEHVGRWAGVAEVLWFRLVFLYGLNSG